MKSRVKLDVDYNNNPKIVLDVYRTDHVLDKILNKLIDETDYATSELNLRGFLINENYLPSNRACASMAGSERESNYRGSYSFVPLSREMTNNQLYLPIELMKDFPNPENKITLETTNDWYYEIDKRSQKIKRILDVFNQSTEDIDYIIRAMNIPFDINTTIENSDEAYGKEKEFNNCVEDPLLEQIQNSIIKGAEETKERISWKNLAKDEFKYTIIDKLYRTIESLEKFNLNTDDIEIVIDYIKNK